MSLWANLCLLGKLNKEVGRKPFSKKKTEYGKTDVLTPRRRGPENEGHIVSGERTSAGQISHNDRHGRFHSWLPIRLKTARVAYLETWQHSILTRFGTPLHWL